MAENLFHHDVEGKLAPFRLGPLPIADRLMIGAALARHQAAHALDIIEVSLWIKEAVDVVYAKARDEPALDEAKDYLVDGSEDRALFDADGGQLVDVEEAAIVDLVGGDAPEAEPDRKSTRLNSSHRT